MGQVMSLSATCIDLPSTYLKFILLFLHSLIGAHTRVVEYNYSYPSGLYFGLCSLLRASDINMSSKDKCFGISYNISIPCSYSDFLPNNRTF